MSEVSPTPAAAPATPTPPAPPAPAALPPAWPGTAPAPVDPPITSAALFNAAARAAASNSRRDLVEYLRLRRKPA